MPRSYFTGCLALALLLGGCPSGGARKIVPCQRFGQTCEFSPGKLGTCVERTNCTAGDCLVCQSQH
jgi:hypothetical protein